MNSLGFHEALERIVASTVPVFFVGSHKNSGKTTALMRVAHALHARAHKMVLVSIGRDGEMQDQFFGHKKPPVSVMPGMRFVTPVPSIHTAARLLLTLPGFVEGRQLGLFEALTCGEVELWGPPSATELRRVINAVLSFGLTLVDGALDRQAALYQGDCRLVLCCKAVSPNPAAFGLYLSARRALFEVPLVADDDLPEKVISGILAFESGVKEVRIDGPLTQTMAQSLLAAGVGRVVVESPMHVFCDLPTVLRIAPVLQVRMRPVWVATAVNPAQSCLSPRELWVSARQALGVNHPIFDALAW